MIDMRDIYWLAGFYEGEGTICAYSTNGGFLSLRICQKNIEPLNRCQSLFGGKIYHTFNKKRNNAEIDNWVLTGVRAAGMAMTLFPLLTRRRQGQIAKALKTWRAVPTKKQALAAAEARRNPITGQYGSWPNGHIQGEASIR